MLSPRRVVTALVVLLVVTAVGYPAWQAWRVKHDLEQAEASVTRLEAALDERDAEARDRAISDLRSAAASADERTGTFWWSAMTKVPWLGDDAAGVRSLSESLDLLAVSGTTPLADTIDDLDRVSADGRIDLSVLDRLADTAAEAHTAFAEASGLVDDVDSSGFAGPLRVRFDDYVERVGRAAGNLASAKTATEVLPEMVGADGPRDYLLVFQNNAEIRATGGMPGSWALVHAEDGALTIAQQGTAGDFPMTQAPVLPLSDGERDVYGVEYGLYFQDFGFAPDFPRAAELADAWWDRSFPAIDLDGVMALDPVTMSYLLEGTGPIQVGALTLTADNVVEELLNKPYLELDPVAQDELFRDAARAIFDAATADLASPVDFVEGLDRAAGEGRLLVASFDAGVADALAGSRVTGALEGDDGRIPHVDIGLNDATGSKMSYYLRYWADVESTSCKAGTQALSGSMTLRQAISPAEAALLPPSVTGGGQYGTDPGSQLVQVRIYGPWGGTIEAIRIDGKARDDIDSVDVGGRPVVTLSMTPTSRDEALINWTMRTGPGQSGDVELGVTPGILPGDDDGTAASAC